MSDSTFAAVDAVPRDRWGRPLIVPPDGGKPTAYTRVSTLAKQLDDGTGLAKWLQAQTAIGVGLRPDLAQKAATMRDDKKVLGEVVEEAMAVAGASVAANTGTTLHRLTEHVDAGTLPENLPGDLVASLDAYERAMAGVAVVASEMFVVCDAIQAAGSFDRLVGLPDGRVVIADIKTGQSQPRFPHSTAIQLAAYAHGTPYKHPGERGQSLADLGVDQEVGLLIHLPAGQGTCDLYLMDIAQGWEYACLASAARAWYRTKPLTPYTPDAALAVAG